MNEAPGRSAYTSELRVLLCANCGAAFDVSIHGGVVQCRYCSAQSELRPRSNLIAFSPMPAARMSETERMQVLRQQEHRPMPTPPGVADLLGPDFEIPEWRTQDALAVWQSARKRTAAQDPAAAEELAFLNVVLGNQFLRTNDWTKHRAMLESSLEAFFLPRHRSVAATDLCLGACRQGDVAGARAWLALADPASDDLYADSNYRLARAGVSQVENDFQAAVAVLGWSASAIPVHDASEGSLGVARANALERIGQVDQATRELSLLMQSSRRNRDTVHQIIGNSGMCDQSYARVLDAIRRRRGRTALLSTLGKLGLGFGALAFVSLLGVLLWGIMTKVPDDEIGVLMLIGAFVAVPPLLVGTLLLKLGEARAEWHS